MEDSKAAKGMSLPNCPTARLPNCPGCVLQQGEGWCTARGEAAGDVCQRGWLRRAAPAEAGFKKWSPKSLFCWPTHMLWTWRWSVQVIPVHWHRGRPALQPLPGPPLPPAPPAKNAGQLSIAAASARQAWTAGVAGADVAGALAIAQACQNGRQTVLVARLVGSKGAPARLPTAPTHHRQFAARPLGPQLLQAAAAFSSPEATLPDPVARHGASASASRQGAAVVLGS